MSERSPEISAAESRAIALRDDALALSNIKIEDQAGFDKVGSRLRDVVTIRAEIIDLFKPTKADAYKAHQDICTDEKMCLAPIVEAEKVFSRLIGDYEDLMKEKQRELDRQSAIITQQKADADRLQALADAADLAQRQMDAMLEEATTYEEAMAIMGQTPVVVESAVQEAKSEPMPVAVVFVDPVIIPVKGVGTKTVYTVRVDNFRKLLEAIVKNEISISMAEPDEAALKKFANATDGKTSIPGCTILSGTKVTGRKR